MFMPSVSELLILLVIVIVVFGAAKLPQLGGDLGKAIKNFKRGVARDEAAGEQAPAATDNRTASGKPPA